MGENDKGYYGNYLEEELKSNSNLKNNVIIKYLKHKFGFEISEMHSEEQYKSMNIIILNLKYSLKIQGKSIKKD